MANFFPALINFFFFNDIYLFFKIFPTFCTKLISYLINNIQEESENDIKAEEKTIQT